MPQESLQQQSEWQQTDGMQIATKQEGGQALVTDQLREAVADKAEQQQHCNVSVSTATQQQPQVAQLQSRHRFEEAASDSDSEFLTAGYAHAPAQSPEGASPITEQAVKQQQGNRRLKRAGGQPVTAAQADLSSQEGQAVAAEPAAQPVKSKKRQRIQAVQLKDDVDAKIDPSLPRVKARSVYNIPLSICCCIIDCCRYFFLKLIYRDGVLAD